MSTRVYVCVCVCVCTHSIKSMLPVRRRYEWSKNRIKKRANRRRKKRKRKGEENDTTTATTIVSCVRFVLCRNEGGDICNCEKRKNEDQEKEAAISNLARHLQTSTDWHGSSFAHCSGSSCRTLRSDAENCPRLSFSSDIGKCFPV
jgi:hypothetical protein